MGRRRVALLLGRRAEGRGKMPGPFWSMRFFLFYSRSLSDFEAYGSALLQESRLS
jgi:hypothetical protein